LVAVASVALGNASVVAGEVPIKAQLIWGTDGAKPDDKDFKELDPKVREKLRHLRWKNYWVVKAKTQDINDKEGKKFVLSEKCAVEFKELADDKLEVSLYTIKAGGAEKLVKTFPCSLAALKNGEYLILGGDDKEKWDDAWIVIITCGKVK
jgi:hypothetical protein